MSETQSGARNEQTARDINTLGAFCGRRDLPALTRSAVRQACGADRVDVMVLFGGSILAGGDLLADAIRQGIARRYVIVGGAGHTTGALRRRLHAERPDIETEGQPEAELFQRYLAAVHGCRADLLETRSTNCGNNITLLLALLEQEQVPFTSILLCQDAAMQLRMDAGMRLHCPGGVRILNYAAYRAEVVWDGGALAYARPIHGMWPMERYVELLLGEIPRLTDDAGGYGPRGKGFIAHVDVPAPVQAAYARLRQTFGMATRAADPQFATR